MSNLWDTQHLAPREQVIVPGETMTAVFWNAVAQRGDPPRRGHRVAADLPDGGLEVRAVVGRQERRQEVAESRHPTHRELADLPGPAGEAFRAVVRCLEREPPDAKK